MGSTTGRPEGLPPELMYPHERHAGVDISGNLLDEPSIAEQLRHIDKTWGPVKRVVRLRVHPGGSMHDHVHPWDTVVYYPESTYDTREGYLFIAKGETHGVPVNSTDETRISVVFQLT